MTGKKIAAGIIAGVFLSVGVAAYAEAPGKGKKAEGDKGKALFEQKCGVCHPLSRALDQKKNRDGWAATVKKMQKVNGCPVTDEEANEIVNYLTKVRGAK
jgi:mono/diheme cytochrome c family protein